MRDYILLTDSSCDMSPEMAAELGVEVLPLSLTLDGRTYRNYLDGRELEPHDFYEQLRNKASATTSAANITEFQTFMEPHLQEGKDILYLGFSSGLSSTYSASTAAAVELMERYPDRKVLTVDSLCASLGQGLFVYHVAKESKKGGTIEEVRDFAENLKLHICHWFTVEDLYHLKRGGRVSAVSAVLGTALNIKPVLHVDNEGHLINVAKVRGRKASIKALVEQAKLLGENIAEQTVFISHGDCLEEAEYLAGLMRAECGVKDLHINFIGPVIGAHSGPGTLALFFIGTHR